MPSRVRVVLLTSDLGRHHYLALALAASECVELVGVVAESKRAQVLDPAASVREPADAEVLSRHFAERDAAEARWLGPDRDFPAVDVMPIPAGALNTPAVQAWVAERRPEVVQLFGSGLVQARLLEVFAGRVVNLHLGLSPYYRGTATNFWPMVQGAPECVGATIHLATSEVDAGPILAQVRPEAAAGDRTHDLGTKALVAAARLLPRALVRLAAGELRAVTQDASLGRVYRHRDFNAEAVRTSWRLLDTGLIPEYVAAADERQAQYPIVSLPD